MNHHRVSIASIFVFLVLAVAMVIICSGCYRGTETYVTAKVLKAERVSMGSGDTLQHRYLVFTEHETFEVADTITYGRFNSSDLYGRLEIGKTYRLKVAGWRIPIFSSYRNIIEAQSP